MKEVACIVSKPLVSCLWGCGESVNPQKFNIQGGFVKGPLPWILFTFVKSHTYIR